MSPVSPLIGKGLAWHRSGDSIYRECLLSYLGKFVIMFMFLDMLVSTSLNNDCLHQETDAGLKEN